MDKEGRESDEARYIKKKMRAGDEVHRELETKRFREDAFTRLNGAYLTSLTITL